MRINSYISKKSHKQKTFIWTPGYLVMWVYKEFRKVLSQSRKFRKKIYYEAHINSFSQKKKTKVSS